jgi:hypothetical protein
MLQSQKNKPEYFNLQPSKKINKRSILLITKYSHKKMGNSSINRFITNSTQNEFDANLFFENTHLEKRNIDVAKDENNPLFLLTQAWWND